MHKWRHPLVTWIWAGATTMALGGAVSMADRRFRAPRLLREAAPAAAAAPVPAPAE
ncbi:MAG: cytochrome c-type biogenesis CcmF C-terminal domain-containing protein [Thermaurantiacus sp.]